jgi:hypothetical protein
VPLPRWAFTAVDLQWSKPSDSLWPHHLGHRLAILLFRASGFSTRLSPYQVKEPLACLAATQSEGRVIALLPQSEPR